MNSLLLELIKSMSIIAVCAYIFSQTKTFRITLLNRKNYYDRILAIIFFTSMSILGTYMNIPVNGALANTRPIGAAAAGLFYGPVTGLIVGLIAGLQRYMVGGFTALPCSISTVFGGFVGGLFYYYTKSKNRECDTKIGLLTGIIIETVEMLLIMIISKPSDIAAETVKAIAIPMIAANSIGISIFVKIINNTKEEFSKLVSVQAQKVLNIANMTLPHLRKGFDSTSSKIAAQIILEKSDADAVCITDNKESLAYVGAGSDHHSAGRILNNTYEGEVIKNGSIKIINSLKQIECSHNKCPLTSAILAPLKFKGERVEGILIFYYKKNKRINDFDIEFIIGIARLLATQLELAKLEKQAEMATAAELKVLQAQIHPHFLFNALNTIASFCRTDPAQAKDLILSLSTFFRKTLNREGIYVTIEEEIDLVNSYLSIEKARFGERLNIAYSVPKHLLKRKIPAFIIQPLVENSIKHGISPCPNGGKVEIRIEEKGDMLSISVSDTGIGMSPEKLKDVLYNWPGIGLKNVNERLKNFYGNSFGLTIKSEEGMGTKVHYKILK